MPIILWWGAGLLLSGFGLKLVNDEVESSVKMAIVFFVGWLTLKKLRILK